MQQILKAKYVLPTIISQLWKNKCKSYIQPKSHFSNFQTYFLILSWSSKNDIFSLREAHFCYNHLITPSPLPNPVTRTPRVFILLLSYVFQRMATLRWPGLEFILKLSKSVLALIIWSYLICEIHVYTPMLGQAQDSWLYCTMQKSMYGPDGFNNLIPAGNNIYMPLCTFIFIHVFMSFIAFTPFSCYYPKWLANW